MNVFLVGFRGLLIVFSFILFPLLASAQEQSDSSETEALDLTDSVHQTVPAQSEPSAPVETRNQTALKATPTDTAVVDTIGEIVVTASRWAEKKSEVPNRIAKITAEDAALRNPQTSADLLGCPEIFVQKSQLGGGSPMIRGFSANRLLIAVDGVRMNNAIYRSGNLQNVISIDANVIDNVEAAFGPGSIVYGSDAIGGVMDFHTVTPSFSVGRSPLLSGNAMTRVSSADYEKTGHLDFTLGLQKLAFITSLSFSDFNDLRMGTNDHDEYTRPEYVERINGSDVIVRNGNKNVQTFTGYDQVNFMEKIRYAPAPSLEIQNAFHVSTTSDIPRYDRLIAYRNGSLRYGDWHYGPQRWLMNALSVKYSKPCGMFDETMVTAAFQDYEESRHSRSRGNNSRLDQTENVRLGSLNADIRKKTGTKGTLVYGLEAVYNNIVSEGLNTDIVTGTETPAASRYPESNYSTGALYAGYKLAFNPMWLASGGLRCNYVSSNGTFDTTLIHLPYDKIELRTGAVNGSAGIVCTPDRGLRINGNLSSGFRAPNVDDMGKLFDPAAGTVIVPNKDLGPEYAWNADAGIVKSFGGLVTIDISGFYTHLQDAMVRREAQFNGKDTLVYNGDSCRVLTLVNSDRAYAYGAYGGMTINLPCRLSLKAFASYTAGKEQDEASGKYLPLRHAAPLSAGGHLIYENEKLKVDLYGDFNDEISFENLALTEQAKPELYAADANGNPYCPSWRTFNLKVGYRFNRYLHLSGGVENILDVRYRPYSSGIVAPGRNFIASIKSSF